MIKDNEWLAWQKKIMEDITAHEESENAICLAYFYSQLINLQFVFFMIG